MSSSCFLLLQTVKQNPWIICHQNDIGVVIRNAYKTWASDKDAFNHGHGADLAQWWLQISGSIWSNMLSIWKTWGPSYGCFLKWWENPHFTPQVRIIFSRKTMENQWLLGTAILGTPRIWFLLVDVKSQIPSMPAPGPGHRGTVFEPSWSKK